MNSKKLILFLFGIALSSIVQSTDIQAQNILQRMRGRMEKGREDGRLVDRMKKRFDDARKSAEAAAKDVEDRLKGNRREKDGDPTLADPRNQNKTNLQNQPQGIREPSQLRQFNTFGAKRSNDHSARSHLRGASLNQSGKRVFVQQIESDSPADKSGLQRGDAIIEVAGFPITKLADIGEVMGVMRPGDRLMMTVVRDNSKKEVLLEAEENNNSVQNGFAPGPIDSNTVGSGAIENGNPIESDQQRNTYPNSMRSVLNRVRQASINGAHEDERIEMRQEIIELRDVVERQNQLILRLQKELSDTRSRSNTPKEQNSPQLLGPRRTGG